MATTRSASLLALLLLVSATAAAAGTSKGRAGVRPCQDLATRGQCAASGGCRWCRSEALDDMCFEAIEAWRLPRQVFSCDPPSGAAHARFN
jgi:uncharacterized membrane protein|uniref:Uncharacterized protein n=1 Tax=Zea mays TaxID=4577 RepID=B6U786_MAIZE|nr:hypothetical protein [Zea mays]